MPGDDAPAQTLAGVTRAALAAYGSTNPTAPATIELTPPPADAHRRLKGLNLQWPSTRHNEVIRVYDTHPRPPQPIIVPGALFDLMI